MSRKTTIFRRKIKQSGVDSNNVHMILPNEQVRGVGAKSQYVTTEGTDDDGNPTKQVKRLPGIDTGLVCSEPMGNKKRDIITRLAKKK